MPLALWALTLSAFAIGTTEFVIVGLIPTIAASLHVDVPSAGLLVSLYALGVAIGAPVLTALTGRIPRETKGDPAATLKYASQVAGVNNYYKNRRGMSRSW